MKNINIIINPAAGQKEDVLPVINRSMKAAGIDWQVDVTKKSGDGKKLAQAAVQKKVDAIGVYGGDGTIMDVISGMIGSNVPLAVLPGGTANVVATGLGIPKDLGEASALMTGDNVKLRAIDVARMDGRFFVVSAGMGFEADMIQGTGREAKSKAGILAYARSAVSALKKQKKVRYAVSIDGKEFRTEGFTCVVSNGGNLGFMNIPLDRHIDMSDGLLDLIIVRKKNFDLFKHFLVMLARRERPDNNELVGHWQGKKISVSSRPEQLVQYDGELLGKQPINAEVLPSAVRIFVPRL